MRSLVFVSPVMLLCFGSIFVLTVGLWCQTHAFLLGSSLVALLGAAAGYLAMGHHASQDAFAGLLVHDKFGNFFSIFAVLVTVMAVVMSSRSNEIKSERRSEYYSILLALCSGLIFMGNANHLLMIYLAIETVSILSYTLAGFHRENSASVEASMKYVVYGSMASAIMVYGMSLLFGATGQVTLLGLREYVAHTPADQIPMLLWVSVLFIFAGIGYKVSAAPMHMWTPDVYEGAPTPVSALLSVAPKAAGFALLIRFFVTAFTLPLSPGEIVAHTGASAISFHLVGAFNWPKFLMISSVFTMFMGNLAALGQVSVKRILAYSSIAHAGYILMGSTTQTYAGLYGMVFYILLYCFMNLGAFWVASKVEDGFGGDELRHFRGLAQRKPFYAVAMAVFLFSLVGLPPFAGFIGKLYLFSAIIAREMYGFAILAAINSVISLYYYVKIIKAMFLEQPEGAAPANLVAFESKSSFVFLCLLMVPNFVLGIYWEPVLKIAKGAVVFFTGR
ncbi:MAG: NADH-quinone oxidoreductase subunit N [Bdellovibrionales bacterium]|nr:NADH-quinone oxidoreductase subunit N [Bdellovibrionales bacterium]